MSAAPTPLRDALCKSLVSVAKFNRAVQVSPATVLWPDRDAIWLDAMPTLRNCLPGLLTYGDYDPERRTGPAIWLKCVIAGLLPTIDLKGQIPIIYLPGVSRADLRAIESCPRDLQPLAELQYRGVFWSQENAKDWTLNAYLSSKNGGLGLSVSQDRATQEALGRVLKAGLLLDQGLTELGSRVINAEWLDSLLTPNIARDLLFWLNAPKEAEDQWQGPRWDVFVSRCQKEFNLHPKADGELIAAEKLVAKQGKWADVWERFCDSYQRFPNLVDQLERVRPPVTRGFFDDLSAYPQENADQEDTLRRDLKAIGELDLLAARNAIRQAEDSHGQRRQWLWARMGRAPLAEALEHLAQVADLSTQEPGGATVEQIATKYQDGGWRVDDAAMRALGAVQTKADQDAVSSALQAIYVPWLEKGARSFQVAVTNRGGLNSKIPGLSAIHDGTCVVFVDGLRYDVAIRLQSRLQGIGEVALSGAWTCLPSVTASGKAWVSPIAHLVTGHAPDDHFYPDVAEDGKELRGYNFEKLLQDNGFQVLGANETGDPTGRAWAECGDLDSYGHKYGLRLARDLDVQLDLVMERLRELQAAGWSRLRIVTDHGWLLVPGELPKAALAAHEAQTRPGRCALLKESAWGTPLTFGWDWNKSVQVAMAPGIGSFRAGLEYAHGGLSIQEALVPVLEVTLAQALKKFVTVDITKATWKGLRVSVEIAPALEGLQIDLRTKPAQAESTVAASMKSLDDGKASLVVANDDLDGTAAVLVVLDSSGAVVGKQATTIGG